MGGRERGVGRERRHRGGGSIVLSAGPLLSFLFLVAAAGLVGQRLLLDNAAARRRRRAASQRRAVMARRRRRRRRAALAGRVVRRARHTAGWPGGARRTPSERARVARTSDRRPREDQARARETDVNRDCGAALQRTAITRACRRHDSAVVPATARDCPGCGTRRDRPEIAALAADARGGDDSNRIGTQKLGTQKSTHRLPTPEWDSK